MQGKGWDTPETHHLWKMSWWQSQWRNWTSQRERLNQSRNRAAHDARNVASRGLEAARLLGYHVTAGTKVSHKTWQSCIEARGTRWAHGNLLCNSCTERFRRQSGYVQWIFGFRWSNVFLRSVMVCQPSFHTMSKDGGRQWDLSQLAWWTDSHRRGKVAEELCVARFAIEDHCTVRHANWQLKIEHDWTF